MTEFAVRDGVMTGLGMSCRVAIGRSGVVAEKQEGDGGTPSGRMRLVRVLYRADRVRVPETVVQIEPLGKADGWCDDPGDPAYNKQVRLPYGGRHEELWCQHGLYDILGVLDWNFSPVIPGRGSAIFLHVATPAYAPTAGCLALGMSDLRACLAAGLTSVLVLRS